LCSVDPKKKAFLFYTFVAAYTLAADDEIEHLSSNLRLFKLFLLNEMSTPIQPISGFRQFTKTEAVAIMEAKTAKVSATFERELRAMQEKMHTTMREIVKDQLALLSNRIEQNAKDIRKLLDRKDGDGDEIRTLVNKNRENIEQLDSNIKTIDQEVREFRG
tara:strand:+ start:280 stop:762 length:483 start_codon:yes stop_codon:yes gene_type:complete